MASAMAIMILGWLQNLATVTKRIILIFETLQTEMFFFQL